MTPDQPLAGGGVVRSKAARQAAVVDVISRRAVRSQTQLGEALVDAGHTVTQATLSRELISIAIGRSRIQRLPAHKRDRLLNIELTF